jgi:BirA family biotin operon repressor/biotin-[acetyl-CoA-carboxylase] ligase
VAEALAEQGVAVALKWPNDVLLHERKLGGILVEAAVSTTAIEWAVVGIGLNLAIDRGQLPDALREGVASVAAAGELTAPDALGLAACVARRLRAWSARIDEDGRAPVIAAWLRHAVEWWGSPGEAREDERVIVGIARGLDERGAFVIELPDGTRRALLSAEVREVRVRPPDRR